MEEFKTFVKPRPKNYLSIEDSFPTFNHQSFPVDALVIRYVINLLPHSPLHTVFLNLVAAFIGLKQCKENMLDVFGTENIDLKKIDASTNLSGLFEVVMKLLTDEGYGSKEEIIRNIFLNSLQSVLDHYPIPQEYKDRSQKLIDVLDLTRNELDVLEVLACKKQTGLYASYCDEYPQSDKPLIYAISIGVDISEFRNALKKESHLFSAGLIGQGLSIKDYEPSVFIYEYLVGLNDDFLHSDNFTTLEPSDISMSSFPVPKEMLSIMKQLLQSQGSSHLLFYGQPGTGKTELAKSLASSVGKKAYLVQYGQGGDDMERADALMGSVVLIPSDALIIIDEADDLLNTMTFFKKGVDKGWINNFLDNNRHKIIWISNTVSRMEDSVLRRFSFSYQFKKFSEVQRESLWLNLKQSHQVLAPIRKKTVSELSKNYNVNAGGIVSAVEAVSKIYSGKHMDEKELTRTMSSILSQHEKLTGYRLAKKNRNVISPFYDSRVLNLDTDSRQLISSLKKRESQRTEKGYFLPANILFWGVPGSGKSEFAKFIARELGKDILVKRLSELLDAYVGGTEKKIAEAFEQAEEEGQLLLLDEVDSLLINRKTAQRSWESSRTNELLMQMESFSGICICSTNVMEKLDEASLRRFSWKVQFFPLDLDGKIVLYRKYFQPKGRLSEMTLKNLKRINNLTPGDFKTVWQNLQYYEQSYGPSLILESLIKESDMKTSSYSGRIGF